MKIALAQLNIHVGNFEQNKAKIIAAIGQAEAQGAEIVLFSELSVCGYPSRDFLEFDHYIQLCESSVLEIAAHTKNIAAVVGAPARNPVKEGKDLYNAAYFLYDGKIQQVIHKTLLPTYDVFDEYRYFEPNKEFKTVQFKEQKIAVTVCEDIWNVGNDNPLYTVCPLDELRSEQPDFILNLSASPFSYKQHEERTKVIQANCQRYGIPMVYVNQVGAQTELVFDGGSIVADAQGNVVKRLSFFEEALEIIDTKDLVKANDVVPSEIERIHDALVLGIKDYFAKLGFSKAVLGLSGGVDSALVLYLAVQALGKGNVLSVLLPSHFSSSHSVEDSLALVKNLGSPHEVIEIEDCFQQYLTTLKPQFKDLPFGIAEENIQARVRGTLLMAMSNKFGYILLNTTNKSEAAVGYGTLYGDMCGGLAVLGDVYKTQIYDLCKFINRNTEIIPEHILTKAPSAELRPNQKDSDSLPDYDILDKVLFQYIEQRKGPVELVAMGFDEALVKRVLRMVNMNEWKRFQAAPILRVSPKAFGMGRRMPIEGRYLG
ncbi:MAG: NAD+ synthase [Chitinophagales bacterium]|nr:NAD+ synthase [Chitinophagales bacterium]